MKTNSFYPAMLLAILCFNQDIAAQLLMPGFDKAEYIETLKINNKAHILLEKWPDTSAMPPPEDYNFVYRSPVVAFDKNKPIGMIAVQGSIQTSASFLANLYAAMIPAKGTLQLSKEVNFTYALSENPNAAVHVGWLVSMAYMAPTIEHEIDSCYKRGIKDFILTGHSQGGGVVFLLNSYLQNLQHTGRLPADIRFKTYCSAGPKPGNLFYAYDYENMTKGGWAFNVVNSADWVPDVPFTVQTVNDFTAVNPFRHAKTLIKRETFLKRIILRHVYNQLSRSSIKAQKHYQKYLGKMVSKAVKKQIPGFIPPAYYASNYYVRAGNTIVLYADDVYFKLFNNDKTNPNIWQHHLPVAYLYLAKKL